MVIARSCSSWSWSNALRNDLGQVLAAISWRLRSGDDRDLRPPAEAAVAAAGPARLAGRASSPTASRSRGRTVRRDVERLRELGYPVESLTGPAGGYRLAAGTAMPPLLLDDDEAIAIAVGLRTAARRVGDRDRGDVGARAGQARAGAARAPAPARAGARRRDHDAADRGGADRRPPGADAARRRLPRPRAAALRLQRARRRPEPPRGRAALARQRRPPLVPRRVGLRPRGLAHVPRRPARRARAPTGARFDAARAARPSDPAAFVAANLLRARPYRYEARVTLHAPAERAAQRAPRLRGTVEPLDEERCEYRTGDDSLDWLAVRIAMLGVDFEVHEPPELVERLRRARRRGSRARRADERSDLRLDPGGEAQPPRSRARQADEVRRD